MFRRSLSLVLLASSVAGCDAPPRDAAGARDALLSAPTSPADVVVADRSGTAPIVPPGAGGAATSSQGRGGHDGGAGGGAAGLVQQESSPVAIMTARRIVPSGAGGAAPTLGHGGHAGSAGSAGGGGAAGSPPPASSPVAIITACPKGGPYSPAPEGTPACDPGTTCDADADCAGGPAAYCQPDACAALGCLRGRCALPGPAGASCARDAECASHQCACDAAALCACSP